MARCWGREPRLAGSRWLSAEELSGVVVECAVVRERKLA